MDGHGTTARERVAIYLGRRKVPPQDRTVRQVVVSGVLAGVFYGFWMGIWFSVTNGWEVERIAEGVVAGVFFGTIMTLWALWKRRQAMPA